MLGGRVRNPTLLIRRTDDFIEKFSQQRQAAAAFGSGAGPLADITFRTGAVGDALANDAFRLSSAMTDQHG